MPKRKKKKTYTAQIEDVDANGTTVRIPRKITNEYYRKIVKMPSSNQKVGGIKPGHHPTTQGEEWRFLLNKKVKTRHLKSRMDTAHQIVCFNQVSCSFLGFCLMAHLTNPSYVKEITGYTWKEIASDSKTWMKTWQPLKEIGMTYTGGKGGMPHIGFLLDLLYQKPLSFTTTYLPIRGISDNKYNKDIITETNYSKAMYEIETKIKQLIDEHGQIIANIAGHTRCFIGYDDKHFVAYDSYNNNLKQLRVIHDVNKIMEQDVYFRKELYLEKIYNDKDIDKGKK